MTIPCNPQHFESLVRFIRKSAVQNKDRPHYNTNQQVQTHFLSDWVEKVFSD